MTDTTVHTLACAACLGLGQARWDFTIGATLKSQNRSGANAWATRFAYQRARTEWLAALMQVIHRGEAERLRSPAHRIVRLTRYYGPRKRPYDVSNLVGGTKVLFDVMGREIRGRGHTLPAAGLIWDDSPKWFTPLFAQTRSTHDAVRVEIWEAPLR